LQLVAVDLGDLELRLGVAPSLIAAGDDRALLLGEHAFQVLEGLLRRSQGQLFLGGAKQRVVPIGAARVGEAGGAGQVSVARLGGLARFVQLAGAPVGNGFAQLAVAQRAALVGQVRQHPFAAALLSQVVEVLAERQARQARIRLASNGRGQARLAFGLATALAQEVGQREISARLALGVRPLRGQARVQGFGARGVACARVAVGGAVTGFFGVAWLAGQGGGALVVLGGSGVLALHARRLGSFTFLHVGRGRGRAASQQPK
jgi:hypothetical protein